MLVTRIFSFSTKISKGFFPRIINFGICGEELTPSETANLTLTVLNYVLNVFNYEKKPRYCYFKIVFTKA